MELLHHCTTLDAIVTNYLGLLSFLFLFWGSSTKASPTNIFQLKVCMRIALILGTRHHLRSYVGDGPFSIIWHLKVEELYKLRDTRYT